MNVARLVCGLNDLYCDAKCLCCSWLFSLNVFVPLDQMKGVVTRHLSHAVFTPSLVEPVVVSYDTTGAFKLSVVCKSQPGVPYII